MKQAIVGRGVTHLILPNEVQHHPAAVGAAAGGPAGRLASRSALPPADELARAIEMIQQAKRQMIVVGAGCRNRTAGIVALGEHLAAPVATTFKAKGLISDSHPLGSGVMGRSGTPGASWCMNESNLLIVFGASFSNHTGIAPYKTIIQIDDDPMSIGRFHGVDAGLLGDVDVTARAITAALVERGAIAAIDQRDDVAQRWAIWRAEKERRAADDSAHGIDAAAVMASLTRLIDADAVLAVDVGNNTYSFGRYFEASGRQDLVMSAYLGSIGFALPAAMGVWAAVGDTRQIVSISDDGGFGQYAMELTTAVKYAMNITHTLLKNGELGKISKEQRAALWDVWQTSLHNPDFAVFAELCGARGFRANDPTDLDAALAAALAHPGPALVEVVTNPLLV